MTHGYFYPRSAFARLLRRPMPALTADWRDVDGKRGREWSASAGALLDEVGGGLEGRSEAHVER